MPSSTWSSELLEKEPVIAQAGMALILQSANPRHPAGPAQLPASYGDRDPTAQVRRRSGIERQRA